MELSEEQWAIIDQMASKHEVVVHDPVERNLREGTAVYVAGVDWYDNTPIVAADTVVYLNGYEEIVPR